MTAASRQTYLVEGMTCAHCVAAVKGEIGALAGVSEVEVELESGSVIVDSAGVDAEAVRAAVEEAGYRLAG